MRISGHALKAMTAPAYFLAKRNSLPPQPQTPLPDTDHVLRYIGRRHVDNGVVNGSGFMRRPQEDTPPSVNWMECFPLPIENQVWEISARRRIRYEKRGLLVRINVGHTMRHVEENATIPITLAFLHDPLPAEEGENGKPADDSYHFHIRVTWLCRGMRLWI